MSVILYLLIVFGCIYVVVDSAIFAPIRILLATRSMWLEIFIYCAYCTGFWIGAVGVFALTDWSWSDWWNGHLLFDEFCGGAATMGAISVIRGFAPHFLSGAWEREREIIEERRDAGRGEPTEGDAGGIHG